MKIYTRSGDDGTTDLYGGERVRKSSLRVSAYGAVDELNASFGWSSVGADDAQRIFLERESARLFDLGAHLAATSQAKNLPLWDDGVCSLLEQEIDTWEEKLTPLKTFILPGGCELAARLHLTRTICRRAERGVASLALEEPVSPQYISYLNRLSDWLFVFARIVNAESGNLDILWMPEKA